MIFNSAVFLFAFFPLVLLLFFVERLRFYRTEILLVLSLCFYAYSGVQYAIMLAAETAAVYWIVSRPDFTQRRSMLALAIGIPMAVLIFYKYANFLLRDVLLLSDDSTGPAFRFFHDAVLPAGISFFTFEFISFAIDRWRGKIIEVTGFSKFALYVSFFPHLVAGPILRWSDVAAPLERLRTFQLDQERALCGFAYIIIGLGYKVLIADSLDGAIAPLREHIDGLASAGAAFVILAYSFQIYFDFYGYSLIAIGLGKLFGFDFPANFNEPYRSVSPQEFWRRWHITLSFWIRDYLYFPLGGNRNYYRNIPIIFLICGLWHGAGWNFAIWGLYHACLVVGYRLVSGPWDKMPKLLQQALTFTLVSVGWLLFAFNLPNAAAVAAQLLHGSASAVVIPAAHWAIVIIAAGICFGLNIPAIAERRHTRPALLGLSLGLLIAAVTASLGDTKDFIYFRF